MCGRCQELFVDEYGETFFVSRYFSSILNEYGLMRMGLGGGNRTRSRDIVNNNNTNNLQDIKNGEVAKNWRKNTPREKTCKSSTQNNLQDINSQNNTSLISAINAVNSLPFTDEEKVDTIKRLMNETNL